MDNPQFTCISCAIAFLTADDQRDHYKNDHHRYNMKRRVAGLPPIDLVTFDQKVQERRAETALTTSAKGRTCDSCRKVYTTENAYKAHLLSKKHREKQLAAEMTPHPGDRLAAIPKGPAQAVSRQDDETPEDSMGIEAKIAVARSRLPPTSCLFCSDASDSIESNVAHMQRSHGFFIPDRDYLVDLPGLLTYLGEKVAVQNVCIWCNGKGKALHSLDAVRRHMYDKSHCKIAYDTLDDRLDVSDHYDFTSSYDRDPRSRGRRHQGISSSSPATTPADDAWEDAEDVIEDEVDEIVEDAPDGEDDALDDLHVSYGDTPYELVLPSGARIGHRSLRRYYVQRFSNPLVNASAYADSETSIVKRLIKDKRTAMIPASGADFGGAGRGMMTIKVRSLGVAKEAGRHIREHRDSRKKEAFKTKIGFVGNQQKHYRDQLLQ